LIYIVIAPAATFKAICVHVFNETVFVELALSWVPLTFQYIINVPVFVIPQDQLLFSIVAAMSPIRPGKLAELLYAVGYIQHSIVKLAVLLKVPTIVDAEEAGV
jgi:hypothetical protein